VSWPEPEPAVESAAVIVETILPEPAPDAGDPPDVAVDSGAESNGISLAAPSVGSDRTSNLNARSLIDGPRSGVPDQPTAAPRCPASPDPQRRPAPAPVTGRPMTSCEPSPPVGPLVDNPRPRIPQPREGEASTASNPSRPRGQEARERGREAEARAKPAVATRAALGSAPGRVTAPGLAPVPIRRGRASPIPGWRCR
jgi:hypothetical protein